MSVLEYAGTPRDRGLILLLAVLQVPILLLAVLSPETFTGCCVIAAGCIVLALLADHFERVVFAVFCLVAWFPEFSQTDWDVWSADDFHSLYNYKPIPAITASYFDYFFAFILLLWLAQIGWPRRKELLETFLAKPMLWFLGLSGFSLLFGIAKGYPAYYALREFRVSAYFVISYFIGISVFSSRARIAFAKLLGVTGIAVGCVGIARYALGIGKEYYGELLVYYDIADSMVLYLAAFVLVSFWIVRKRGALILLAASIPIAFSLIFSFRRGAWLAFAAGLLGLLIVHGSRTDKGARSLRWVGAAMLLLVVVGVLFILSNSETLVTERLTSMIDLSDDTSNIFRIMDSLNALITFSRHPILGIGSGGQYDFEYYSEAIAPAVFWENVSRACHNGYLYIMFKMGIVGFVAYISIFYKFARKWLRARRLIAFPRDRIVHYAMGAGVFAIMVNNITSPVSDSLRPTMLLAIAMACASTLMMDVNDLKSSAASNG